MPFFLLAFFFSVAAHAMPPADTTCPRDSAALGASAATTHAMQIVRALVEKKMLGPGDLDDFAARADAANPVDFAHGRASALLPWRTAFESHSANHDFDVAAVRAEARLLADTLRGGVERREFANEKTALIVQPTDRGELSPGLRVPNTGKAELFNVGGEPRLLFKIDDGMQHLVPNAAAEIDLVGAQKIRHENIDLTYHPTVHRAADGESLLLFPHFGVYRTTAAGLKLVSPPRVQYAHGSNIPPMFHERGPGDKLTVYDGLNSIFYSRFEDGDAAKIERVSLGAEPLSMTPIHGTRFLSVMTPKSFVIVDTTTNAIHWEVPLEHALGKRSIGSAPVVSGKHLVFRTEKEIHIVDPETKTEIAKFPASADDGSRPMIALRHAGGDYVLAAQTGHIDIVDMQTKQLAAPLVTKSQGKVIPHVVNLPNQTLVLWNDSGTLQVADFSGRVILNKGTVPQYASIFPFVRNGQVFAAVLDGNSPKLVEITTKPR